MEIYKPDTGTLRLITRSRLTMIQSCLTMRHLRFSMISLIQTRALIETLSLIPIMTCLTVRHLCHESCISAHLQ